ncbi:MAG: hypothetical protein WDO74_36530 [Pseudomonadota bacterium]
MGSTPALRANVLLLLAWTFATGCDGTNGSDASPCRIDTDVLCPGNFVGYSCQSEAKPSPTCGPGTHESDGEIGYCCEVQNTGRCEVDASAGCTDGSTGYSCSAGVQPHATEPSLACSAGVAGPNADERYCCIRFNGSAGSCTANAIVAGCTVNSYGFSCTETDTPDQTQTSLLCSSATTGPNDELLYCCSTS